MNLNWIEINSSFPQIDESSETYFEDYEQTEPAIYEYGFKTIPEFKKMIAARTGSVFSEKEILEISKTTFRNKPEKEIMEVSTEDRQIVDFIYQF